MARKPGRQPLCPSTPTPKPQRPSRKKDQDDPPPLDSDDEGPPMPAPGHVHAWIPSDTAGTGSAHKGKHIGQWDEQDMKQALTEFDYWEKRRVRQGLAKPEKSKAAIARKWGLSPATFGNRTIGKVHGFKHASGGARQPKVLSVGKSTDMKFKPYVFTA